MVKKVIGYLLLCCFFNVLTTLPAKCCESGVAMHRHTGKAPTHSLTILQHLLDLIDDDILPLDTGIDVHCSVFNEARPVSIQSARFICEAGTPAISAPAIAIARHALFNARPFAVPQHHNFLFRLTPF